MLIIMQIVVVGSSNVDLIAYTPKMPKIGETLKVICDTYSTYQEKNTDLMNCCAGLFFQNGIWWKGYRQVMKNFLCSV